jgi:hypothetical protein
VLVLDLAPEAEIVELLMQLERLCPDKPYLGRRSAMLTSMFAGRWSRPPWVVMLLCAHAGTALAQAPETTAPSGEPSPTTSAAVPRLSTVWLSPSDPHIRLTYSIEVDASLRMLPGLPPPNRRATDYRGHFEPLCAAPCSVRLPQGSYSLGISKDGGKDIPATNPLVVNRETTVIAYYQSNRWRRGLGIALIATGAVLGGYLVVRGTNPPCGSDGDCVDFSGAVAAGSIVLSVGMVSGIILLATGGDSAHIAQR